MDALAVMAAKAQAQDVVAEIGYGDAKKAASIGGSPRGLKPVVRSGRSA
jgi:hypothetical protein